MTLHIAEAIAELLPAPPDAAASELIVLELEIASAEDFARAICL
jgi:hypothetical protein